MQYMSCKLIRPTATDSIWHIATETGHAASRPEVAEGRAGGEAGWEAAEGHSLPVGQSYCAQCKYN